MFTRRILSLVILAVIAAQPAVGSAPEKQVAWPSADAVVKAKRDVAELYRDRIKKAKKPCDKVALGRELLKVAGGSGDDPAAQFVLFYAARNLAMEAKDWFATLEAIAAIVDRFKVDGPADPAEQIDRGDALCAAAKKEPAGQRLPMQPKAAEWYVRAKQNSKGLQGRIADKRLAELAESIDGKTTLRQTTANNADLKSLIGTWEVVATNGYKGQWVFYPDNTVSSQADGSPNGKWSLINGAVSVQWNSGAWETLRRPLKTQGTTGDSGTAGPGSVIAKKIGLLPK